MHKNGFLNSRNCGNFRSLYKAVTCILMIGKPKNQKNYNTYMEVITMEEISVKKSEVIRFRVAELLHKVSRFVKSFSYRMEVIK